ncbi:MAG: FAD-binding protein [Rhodospirillaceae bacterium]|nr:FAD-binding protein [Rhodospirillaceae bacterium]
MAEDIRPQNENELQQLIASAYSAGTGLEIIGQGTKRGLGHRVKADLVIDLSNISGITLYEPEELVMSAYGGTPTSEINAALGAKGQMLAFEPWDPAQIYGTKQGKGTIGGLFMTGFAGPRRISAGAPRDHLLGVNAINGAGEMFKSGGRVVKNVSGFDIPKLMAGSFGTLAVASQLTFKVLPRPEALRTVLLKGLSIDEAGKAMRAVMASPHEASGAAHLPAALSCQSEIDEIATSNTSITILRVEGPRPSAEYRADAIGKMLNSFGHISQLRSEKSAMLWREIRDVQPLCSGDAKDLSKHIWRVSLAPTDGPRLVNWVEKNTKADFYMDWSGGLVWISLDENIVQFAEKLRSIVSGFGGHATLVRANDDASGDASGDDRDLVGVFNPLGRAIDPLVKRVKQSFDPDGILNPGRMFGAEQI